MTRRKLSYQQAVQIVKQYQEVPLARAEQIELLQMAGYTMIQGRAYSKIPDQQLFRITENTRARAERTIGDYLSKEATQTDKGKEAAQADKGAMKFLIDEAAKDQFKRLYALFGFDPDSEYAPEPEQLEELLER